MAFLFRFTAIRPTARFSRFCPRKIDASHAVRIPQKALSFVCARLTMYCRAHGNRHSSRAIDVRFFFGVGIFILNSTTLSSYGFGVVCIIMIVFYCLQAHIKCKGIPDNAGNLQ